jgi:hypothetical protein
VNSTDEMDTDYILDRRNKICIKNFGEKPSSKSATNTKRGQGKENNITDVRIYVVIISSNPICLGLASCCQFTCNGVEPWTSMAHPVLTVARSGAPHDAASREGATKVRIPYVNP